MKTPTHLLLTPMALLLPQLAMATFTFNSNGTGADGDWTLDETDCPEADTSVVLDVGESGIKQYSSISIHENCVVTFTPTGGGVTNYSQPVRLIVTGDVVINGTLDLSGDDGNVVAFNVQAIGGTGGPGGFDGGHSCSGNGGDGFVGYGPGGGQGGGAVDAYWLNRSGNFGTSVPSTSDVRLQPLIGGSGGGGGGCYGDDTHSSGGGGGGAILVASSGTVTINGKITVQGGVGADSTGGSGAHGMIHLIANHIRGTGDLQYGTPEIVESLDVTSSLGSRNIIEFQQLELDLSPDSQNLQITQLGGEAVTPGTPLVLDQDGEMTLELSSSGLDVGTTIRVAVSNSRAQSVTTADATLDADGNGSVTLTLESGVLMIIAYVVE